MMPTLAPEGRAAGSDSMTDRLYDLGFFFVEVFAALEVTAVIVANARITEGLGLREEMSSYILNSYLYPLFAVMLGILLFSKGISRAFHPLRFFLAGLFLFAAGNAVCFAAPSPSWFFSGRAVMGVGGALSFAGQLWTLSVFHRRRLTRTLIWGESGTALGVVAGPIVGALFAQFSPEGWRDFFLLNAALSMATAAFAYAGLRNRKVPFQEERPQDDDRHGRKIIRVMTSWQMVVSILVVGSEYLFSDYLQVKAGKSPLFVGGMTVLASIGAILGSVWASRLEHRMEQIPALTAAGLLLSLGALVPCLTSGFFLLAGIPIFASGLFMGLASVSIYASIVHSSAPDQFLTRSMIYLMGMQIGNALGVQAVGLSEMWHLGVLGTAGLLALLPLALSIGTVAYLRSPYR
ncbi:MAG: MFS transporter [Verrucomicrobiae bacterium]